MALSAMMRQRDANGAAAATVTLNSSAPSVGSVPVINASNIGTTFTVDAFAGADKVTVNGTSNLDTINVAKSLTTTVQVNALKTVTLPAAGDEDVTIAAGDGEDIINISGTTSGTQIINVDGGIPTANAVASDRLTITMSAAGTSGVVPGSTPDSGAVTSPNGQTNFSGIEFIVVTGTAAGAKRSTPREPTHRTALRCSF